MTNLIKKAVFKTLSFACLCFSFSAQADFRKALDAYIARDGETMLKEVKHAVDTKNDDGLMLFLMATNMDVATSDYDATTNQSKSTLRAMLPESKWDEMYHLLTKATGNSTLESQYYLAMRSPFSATYRRKRITAEKGRSGTNEISKEDVNAMYSKVEEEYYKKGAINSIIRGYARTRSLGSIERAEAGDPYSQLQLGLQYLNDRTVRYGLGCPEQTQHPICQTKNIEQGLYWLKRAAVTYDSSGVDDFDVYASAMCEYEYKNANGSMEKLKQAYSWCLLGIQERGELSESQHVLRSIRQSKELSKEELALFGTWKVDAVPSEGQLPALLKEIRTQASQLDLPVFTYYFVYGMPYLIEVYQDGRVFISLMDLHSVHKDLLLKTEPKTINGFLDELIKLDIKEWRSKESLDYCFGNTSRTTTHALMQINLRIGVDRSRLYLGSCNKNAVIDGSKTANFRMGKIYSLVEKYFPTVALRCGLGNSKNKKQECLSQSDTWKNIARRK